MIRRPAITDKPRRVNVANYEQRLRKYLRLHQLIVAEIEEVLAEVEAERKQS